MKLVNEEVTIPKQGRFQGVKKNFLRNWQLYVFLLPAILYFVILHYIPMYGVQIAFKNFFANQGIWGSPWIGFGHFERFFNSYYFWRLLKNTFILSGYQLLLFPLPIILALSLNELKNGAFKKWTQTLTYAPHFISVVVVVGMIVIFLDPTTGLVNRLIVAFGGEPIAFLTSPSWFRHVFTWSGVWQTLGWGSIIYLAALSGVNPELHEAAEVDGATRLQRIIHINIPSILPTIVVLFILNIGSFMTVGFEKVLLMQNDLNASTSDVIQTFVYQTGLLEGQYSFAAAIGLFDSAINITLLVVFNYVARKTSDNSLW
ncbi:ABC transporter permease [Pseudogracilibacillus auburnensis]|uniref:Carbohydrate ABC transporter membrane protein 1 (CUT1 family) n=1 Tax=Pseudogracilibacillus auburnensis TaxID=1494959 RepID=A0A2V3WAM3_9BACI|nr:ABC transporter permease subunit [Pseudogracilibacillus auburnensis]MBO1001970.1 sugar ABC transporter permease [Pseudogracilibacillus auburnensis]PXW90194.1 carbohydrate ABC transporter membrane protein 1 (CUT1 family) [Pseudogracilibacillus auburnensis]